MCSVCYGVCRSILEYAKRGTPTAVQVAQAPVGTPVVPRVGRAGLACADDAASFYITGPDAAKCTGILGGRKSVERPASALRAAQLWAELKYEQQHPNTASSQMHPGLQHPTGEQVIDDGSDVVETSASGVFSSPLSGRRGGRGIRIRAPRLAKPSAVLIKRPLDPVEVAEESFRASLYVSMDDKGDDEPWLSDSLQQLDYGAHAEQTGDLADVTDDAVPSHSIRHYDREEVSAAASGSPVARLVSGRRQRSAHRDTTPEMLLQDCSRDGALAGHNAQKPGGMRGDLKQLESPSLALLSQAEQRVLDEEAACRVQRQKRAWEMEQLARVSLEEFTGRAAVEREKFLAVQRELATPEKVRPPPAPTAATTAEQVHADRAVGGLGHQSAQKLAVRTESHAVASTSAADEVTLDVLQRRTEEVMAAAQFDESRLSRVEMMLAMSARGKVQNRLSAKAEDVPPLVSAVTEYLGSLRERPHDFKHALRCIIDELVKGLPPSTDDKQARAYAFVAKLLLELMAQPGLRPDGSPPSVTAGSLIFGAMLLKAPILAPTRGQLTDEYLKIIVLFATMHVHVAKFRRNMLAAGVSEAVLDRFGVEPAWRWLATSLRAAAVAKATGRREDSEWVAKLRATMVPFLHSTGYMLLGTFRWQFVKLLRALRLHVFPPTSEAQESLGTVVSSLALVDPTTRWHDVIAAIPGPRGVAFDSDVVVTEASTSSVQEYLAAADQHRRAAIGKPISALVAQELARLPQPGGKGVSDRNAVRQAFSSAAKVLVDATLVDGASGDVGGAGVRAQRLLGALYGAASMRGGTEGDGSPWSLPFAPPPNSSGSEVRPTEQDRKVVLLRAAISVYSEVRAPPVAAYLGAGSAWRWLVMYVKLRGERRDADPSGVVVRDFLGVCDSMLAARFGRQYVKLLEACARVTLSREFELGEASKDATMYRWSECVVGLQGIPRSSQLQ